MDEFYPHHAIRKENISHISNTGGDEREQLKPQGGNSGMAILPTMQLIKLSLNSLLVRVYIQSLWPFSWNSVARLAEGLKPEDHIAPVPVNSIELKPIQSTHIFFDVQHQLRFTQRYMFSLVTPCKQLKNQSLIVHHCMQETMRFIEFCILVVGIYIVPSTVVPTWLAHFKKRILSK